MYAINVNSDGRIACATYPEFAAMEQNEENVYTQDDMMEGYILVPSIPEDDLSNYLYKDGEYIYDPQAVDTEKPSQMDRIEAQITYTAMMTDTLLEV